MEKKKIGENINVEYKDCDNITIIQENAERKNVVHLTFLGIEELAEYVKEQIEKSQGFYHKKYLNRR